MTKITKIVFLLLCCSYEIKPLWGIDYRFSQDMTLTTTIHLASGDTVTIDPGVTLSQAAGSFTGRYDSLFAVIGVNDVQFIFGAGSKIVGIKDIALTHPASYPKSEWRHIIEIANASNISITGNGARLEKAGGDAIFIGSARHGPSRNISITDLDPCDWYRNAVSITSADGVTLSGLHCTGRSPMTPTKSGFQLEPSSANCRLENILIKECSTTGCVGGGSGYRVQAIYMDQDDPLSVYFYQCVSQGDYFGLRCDLTANRSGKVVFDGITVNHAVKPQYFKGNQSRINVLNCQGVTNGVYGSQQDIGYYDPQKGDDAWDGSFSRYVADRIGPKKTRPLPVPDDRDYLEVEQTNSPPRLQPLENRSGKTGTPLTFPVTAIDVDGDPLRYFTQNSPAGIHIAHDLFTWTPGIDQVGPHHITVTVSDGRLTDSQSFTVDVAHEENTKKSNVINIDIIINILNAYKLGASEKEEKSCEK